MAREGKGLRGMLFEAGTRFVSKAVERVLRDPRGQDAVARAVGMAQRGRRRVEEVQERFMEAAGIPGLQDFQDLTKRLARIKRKARDLAERLDGGEGVPPGNGSGGSAETEERDS